MPDSELLDFAFFEDEEVLVPILSRLSSEGKAVRSCADLCCGPYEVLDCIKMNGGTFVDVELGVVITSQQVLEEIAKHAKEINKLFVISGIPFLSETSVDGDDVQANKEVAAASEPLWYVERLCGWPDGTGSKQKVAVIDSGLTAGHERHPRSASPDADFASLHAKAQPLSDHRWHGTRCAGVIGARTPAGKNRISVAPDCHLVVGQRRLLSQSPAHFVTIEFVLLLVWAVQCRGAQVISFSQGVGKKSLKPYARPEVFSHLSRRLRDRKNALLFCAAGNSGGDMDFPAAAPGVVAVGGYGYPGVQGGSPVALKGVSGLDEHPRPNPEFLWGPAEAVTTTEAILANHAHDTGPVIDHFGDTSAACAFVAGVAALYFEQHSGLCADDVLKKMQAEAEEVLHPDGKHPLQGGVRFPRP